MSTEKQREMVSVMPELALDLNLCATKAADALVPPAIDRRASRLEDALLSLEAERSKMEAFRRELPFSIRLVADVIAIFRRELEQCDSVVEEFVPVKSKLEEEVKQEKDCRDKMNWMSSAQLWSDNYIDTDDKCSNASTDSKMKIMDSETTSLDSKSRGGGGSAFVPFHGIQGLVVGSKKEERDDAAMPDLSLLSSGMKESPSVEEHLYGSLRTKVRAPMTSVMAEHLSLHSQQQQSSRKARRCWSQELHQRFVYALQQLGGPQVATPKQIRELMKVDGLTNDEVKSHLQKYRLHTRRVPNNSSQANGQVVVVGGLWVSQDRYKTCSQTAVSQSGSPQGPLQLAGSAHASSVTAGDSCEEDIKSES